jgi:hypothetical protein
LESFTPLSPRRENLRPGPNRFRHNSAMGQTIDTSHISYVARLLRQSASTMPERKDTRLFQRAASALEDRAARLTLGTPATSGGKLDLLV